MKKQFKSTLLSLFPVVLLMFCTAMFAACEVEPESVYFSIVYQAGIGGSIEGQ